MRRSPLRRRSKLRTRKQLQRGTSLQRTPAMAATDAQRAAVAGRTCIVCGSDRRIDPAHLISRSLGVLCPGWAVLGPAVSGAGRGRRHGSLVLCVVGRLVLSGWGRSVGMVLVAGTSRTFEAFQIAPGTPAAYWTVVDEDFVPVALADDYLRELRFGRGRAVSTTKAYAENLALFFGWASRSGCAVENGPRELGRFVHWLRSSPVERRGTGFGRARSGQRINTILVSVRELYKHGVSMGSLDGRVLDALYVLGDDRFYPAHVRREDGALRSVLRPLHRVSVARRASVDDAKPEEFAALLGACECWRDRFVLAVMYLAGLRLGETLGLRLSDLHFAESSTAVGCSYPGAHLHVVPRANVNGARVKGERARIVPVEGLLVGAFDHYLRRERDACAPAADCDFVFVNLWGGPLGAPMKVSRVHKLFRSLSARAGLERLVHPHMLRHSAGTAWAAAEGLDAAQVLLGHASPTSVGVYVHPSPERQRAAVRKMTARFDGARTRGSEV